MKAPLAQGFTAGILVSWMHLVDGIARARRRRRSVAVLIVPSFTCDSKLARHLAAACSQACLVGKPVFVSGVGLLGMLMTKVQLTSTSIDPRNQVTAPASADESDSVRRGERRCDFFQAGTLSGDSERGLNHGRDQHERRGNQIAPEQVREGPRTDQPAKKPWRNHAADRGAASLPCTQVSRSQVSAAT